MIGSLTKVVDLEICLRVHNISSVFRHAYVFTFFCILFISFFFLFFFLLFFLCSIYLILFSCSYNKQKIGAWTHVYVRPYTSHILCVLCDTILVKSCSLSPYLFITHIQYITVYTYMYVYIYVYVKMPVLFFIMLLFLYIFFSFSLFLSFCFQWNVTCYYDPILYYRFEWLFVKNDEDDFRHM